MGSLWCLLLLIGVSYGLVITGGGLGINIYEGEELLISNNRKGRALLDNNHGNKFQKNRKFPASGKNSLALSDNKEDFYGDIKTNCKFCNIVFARAGGATTTVKPITGMPCNETGNATSGGTSTSTSSSVTPTTSTPSVTSSSVTPSTITPSTPTPSTTSPTVTPPTTNVTSSTTTSSSTSSVTPSSTPTETPSTSSTPTTNVTSQTPTTTPSTLSPVTNVTSSTTNVTQVTMTTSSPSTTEFISTSSSTTALPTTNVTETSSTTSTSSVTSSITSTSPSPVVTTSTSTSTSTPSLPITNVTTSTESPTNGTTQVTMGTTSSSTTEVSSSVTSSTVSVTPSTVSVTPSTVSETPSTVTTTPSTTVSTTPSTTVTTTPSTTVSTTPSTTVSTTPSTTVTTTPSTTVTTTPSTTVSTTPSTTVTTTSPSTTLSTSSTVVITTSTTSMTTLPPSNFTPPSPPSCPLGYPLDATQYFQAATLINVTYADGTTYPCSGAIYSPWTIVTAAHCLFQSSNTTIHPEMTVISAGDGQIRSAAKFIIHPLYNPAGLQNDIALIIMAEPFPLNGYGIGSISIYPNVNVPPGTKCYLVAYGRSTNGPLELQAAQLPSRHKYECSEVLNPQDFDPGRNVCMGMRAQCAGGDGGPVACMGFTGRWQLYGITDKYRGTDFAEPGVFLFAPFFANWVTRNAKWV